MNVFFAEIAQLVEHNLAKVGVASSSLVFRSRDCSGKDAILFIFLTWIKLEHNSDINSLVL